MNPLYKTKSPLEEVISCCLPLFWWFEALLNPWDIPHLPGPPAVPKASQPCAFCLWSHKATMSQWLNEGNVYICDPVKYFKDQGEFQTMFDHYHRQTVFLPPSCLLALAQAVGSSRGMSLPGTAIRALHRRSHRASASLQPPCPLANRKSFKNLFAQLQQNSHPEQSCEQP